MVVRLGVEDGASRTGRVGAGTPDGEPGQLGVTSLGSEPEEIRRRARVRKMKIPDTLKELDEVVRGGLSVV